MVGGDNLLQWPDYLVTVSVLFVSLGIGVFFALYNGGQKTKEQYLLGGRQMSMLPVGLSLFITYQSAISLMGLPADVYNTGTMTIYASLGYSLSHLITYFTVVPLMYPLRLTSVYHYLDIRFQSTILKLIISLTGMVQTLQFMGITLYSPALALEEAAGLPLWVSIVLVGTVATVYTAIGGIKTVVWTDFFQTMVILTAIVAVFCKGIFKIGGLIKMTNVAESGGRLIFDETDLRERHSLWSITIGSCFFWLISSISQSTIQRLSSLPTLTDAQWANLLNIPLNVLCCTGLTLTGVLLYAYIVATGCDPYVSGFVRDKNQLMPYFVLHVLNDLPGLAGLYMSMLFSGSLSTLSSGINALATNTVEDLLVRPLRHTSNTTATMITKILVLLFGAVSIGLAYSMKSLTAPLNQLSVSAASTTGSVILGVYFLAAGFPKSNKYGAGAGALAGLAFNIWFTIGTRLYGKPIYSLPPGPIDHCYTRNTSQVDFNKTFIVPQLGENDWNVTNLLSFERYNSFTVYDISYLWMPVFAFLITILTGIIISCLTGVLYHGTVLFLIRLSHMQGFDQGKAVDPKLIFLFCRKLYKLSEINAEPENLSLDLKTNKCEKTLPVETVKLESTHL